jgi:hypothetical protein
MEIKSSNSTEDSKDLKETFKEAIDVVFSLIEMEREYYMWG